MTAPLTTASPVAPLESLFNTERTDITALQTGAGRAGATGAADWVASNPAALDAISAAVIGDSAWMTAPGTGINQMPWSAISGTAAAVQWRPVAPIVASSKSNMDAFISAIAGTADLRFLAGMTWYDTATKRSYIFTSTVGAYIISAQPIRMFATGTTGVTVDAVTGIATSSAQASLGFGAGCFLDPFTDYNIFFDVTGSLAGTSLQAQFLDSSGAAIATGTLYDIYRTTVFNSAVTSSPLMAQNNIPLSGGIAGASFRHRGRISIRAARDAAVKLFETHQVVTAIPGVAATGGQVSLDGVLNSTQLLTGIVFIAAGAGTITANEIYVEAVPK